MTYRIAIVGTGTIFPVHAQAFLELGQTVSCVADIDAARGQAAANRFGIPNVIRNWRELVDRDDVDIIDICTPPKFHPEIVIAALKHGKHVICEKPLAATLAQVDEIIEATSRSSAQLLAVHQLRYLPFYRRLKWLIDEGRLGKVNFVRVQRYDPPPDHLVNGGSWGNWDIAGGGVLMTKAIHELDMLLGLLGPVKRVQAMMGTFVLPIESEDHLIANIEFLSGAVASFVVTGQSASRQNIQVDVVGSKASVSRPWYALLADGSDGTDYLSEAKRLFPEPVASPVSGWRYLGRRVGRKLGLELFRGESTNSHAPLFREFFRTLDTAAPPPVSAADGRAAVELCTAIYEAALSGEAIVLPLNQGSRFYQGITKHDYHPTKISG